MGGIEGCGMQKPAMIRERTLPGKTSARSCTHQREREGRRHGGKRGRQQEARGDRASRVPNSRLIR